MTPALLTMMQMQGLEGLLGGLMAGETSPFMVARLGTELCLGQIGEGLVQPIGGAVHG
jgi:hypothetical protein